MLSGAPSECAKSWSRRRIISSWCTRSAPVREPTYPTGRVAATDGPALCDLTALEYETMTRVVRANLRIRSASEGRALSKRRAPCASIRSFVATASRLMVACSFVVMQPPSAVAVPSMLPIRGTPTSLETPPGSLRPPFDSLGLRRGVECCWTVVYSRSTNSTTSTRGGGRGPADPATDPVLSGAHAPVSPGNLFRPATLGILPSYWPHRLFHHVVVGSRRSALPRIDDGAGRSSLPIVPGGLCPGRSLPSPMAEFVPVSPPRGPGWEGADRAGPRGPGGSRGLSAKE